jgi:hypothetical protein
VILPISVSHVARITDMSPWHSTHIVNLEEEKSLSLYYYYAGWGYIYKDSYNVSNISYLNLSPPLLSSSLFP